MYVPKFTVTSDKVPLLGDDFELKSKNEIDKKLNIILKNILEEID